MRIQRTDELAGKLDVARMRIASYIMSTADFARRERLWPAHYGVFSTNPLSIAYGATGIALFLHRVLGELPAEVRTWILSHKTSVQDYPPGLFVGLAGIAYGLSEIGLEERAEEIMRTCYKSPLLFADPTMFLGAAGWGTASLYFYARTRRQLYLDKVDEAATYIAREAQAEGETRYWTRAGDDRVNFGYGYGASGIALFLLYAGLVLNRDDVLDVGRRGLEFDLANRVENAFGWTWSDKKDGLLALPYWGHGSSGVGVTMLRYADVLGDRRYLSIAETIGEGAYAKWSVLPSVVDGLSGVGEYMLDLFDATGRPEYLDRAFSIGDTVMWYAIERPAGLAFPGRWMTRISNDYATGSAGIGLFFGRLLSMQPRFLVDFGLNSILPSAPGSGLSRAYPSTLASQQVDVAS